MTDCQQSLLAAHWTEQMDPLDVLNVLLDRGCSDLYVPPDLQQATGNVVGLCLEVAKYAPVTAIALLTSKRTQKGVPRAAWEQVWARVSPCSADVLAVARPDLQLFGAAVMQAMAAAGAGKEWVDNAINEPWRASPGTVFYDDLLSCCRRAGVPAVRDTVKPSVQIHGSSGIRMLRRDRVLVLFLLFFYRYNYKDRVPSDAPQSIIEAQQAEWLRKVTVTPATARHSLSTTR